MSDNTAIVCGRSLGVLNAMAGGSGGRRRGLAELPICGSRVRLTAKLYAQGQPVRQKGDINSIAASFISSVHKARIM